MDEVEKKWHMEEKQVVVLKEVIKTWKTKHEESLNKYTMVKTLKEVKNIVRGYIFNDFPSFKVHLKFYLDFDTLQNQVTKYLNNTQKEAHLRNKIERVEKEVINKLYT